MLILPTVFSQDCMVNNFLKHKIKKIKKKKTTLMGLVLNGIFYKVIMSQVITTLQS